MRILLVEDEPNIARPVERALSAQGHTVAHAPDLASARKRLLDDPYDLLLLDIMLPDHPDGGFVLAQEAMSGGYSGHILFLTARDGLDDRLRGLDGGGDDYLIKPFDLPELLARVRVLMRRDTTLHSSRFTRRALSIDFTTREVFWQGKAVILTPREFSLLERFALHPERIYGIAELHDLIWSDAASDLSVVRQTVRRLRNHLSSEVIDTVPGGYRLGEMNATETNQSEANNSETNSSETHDPAREEP